MTKCILLFFYTVFCAQLNTREYKFSNSPLDVVIPCHEKDTSTLNRSISGIKKYGKNIRNIIVVSSRKLTNNAKYFPESNFPFTKQDLLNHIPHSRKKIVKNRIGWIYQQLIKLYAYSVIPGLSENILILDADTIFLNPVSFIDPETNAGLFNVGSEYHYPYFSHAKSLLPNFKKVYNNYSGICHHMVFQKPVLNHLFSLVVNTHHKPLWKAFCEKIVPIIPHYIPIFSPCSEYEIYFNFAMQNSNQFKIRKLRWDNVLFLNKDFKHKYDYVSAHNWVGHSKPTKRSKCIKKK